MQTASYKIHVSDSIGDVNAIMNIADNPWCSLTLAHGAGAGMTHTFMSALAGELSAHGINTLRFNFPFIEAKKKRPDFAPVAEKTIEAAVAFASEFASGQPFFVSGKSFGGRMSSQYISKNKDARVAGIVFFGFPLHVVNEPATTRAEHLKEVTVPMLFLQGTRDALAHLNLIQEVCSSLPLAELQTFEGADHAFMRGKKSIVSEIAAAATGWLQKQCGRS